MDLEKFQAQYPFPLDDFQVRAVETLSAGESVLVAAPTASGKTVVAEYAIERALEQGRKIFYTTPLKALSNQKFGDFVARYGASRVGLLTGDNTINGEAQVVVMTTEVLRNMLYERSSTLDGLSFVVMDEVHYLQDPYRGAVWEEILIHLPQSVAVVCLSATVSNAEEFGEWLRTLRGKVRVVIEEKRPVPLEHLYMVGSELHAMHVDQGGRPLANPYIVSLSQRELRTREFRRRGDGRRQYHRISRPREGHARVYSPRREEVVEVLEREGKLPAIYFIFSRAGCEQAVKWVAERGTRLTTHEQELEIREFADMRTAWMDEDDLSALGYYEFREALAAGVSAHHAGMIPVFKETVEELFAAGLVKVCFATETLSLGINMPAKTCVIESLWKFSGERHELLTPGEYTQLTGRAGRRGIDEHGYAVVLHQKDVDFERVAGLASTRTYELRSSFRPSYNMAVNLIKNYSPEEARHLLNSSFGQFQADRGVVALERQLDRLRKSQEEDLDRAKCHLGDFGEYWRLREEAEDLRRRATRRHDAGRKDAVRTAVAALRPGDVVFVPRASRRGLAVVLSNREGRATLLTQDRKFFRASVHHFEDPPESLAQIPLPRSGNVKSARYRRDLAARLVSLDVTPRKTKHKEIDRDALARAEEMERRASEHPASRCPDRGKHEKWASKAARIQRDIRALDRRIRSRTETLARQLDRVLAVLEKLGYVKGFRLTEKGEKLARIYGDGDVVVAEMLAARLLEGMGAGETAALVSTLVYESRERVPRSAEMPTADLAARFRRLEDLWSRVRSAEESNQVELTRELEKGFAATAFHWAEGKSLEDVLTDTQMAAGDFVRTCKQLLDLLRQIEQVGGDGQDEAAAAARHAVNRGVVAYTGV